MVNIYKNFVLTLQYDGSNFRGFAPQPGQRTVYSEIEQALEKLFKKKIQFYATSRTDSGVHALNQIISFEISHKIPASKIKAALNTFLPDDIRIIKSEEAPNNFNARFSPKSKVYEYLIFNEKDIPVHLRNISWHVKPKIDLSKMKKAAKQLVGKHDFKSFCAAGGDDKDFVRKIFELSIKKKSITVWDGHKIRVISCKIKGSGFLYKMVRNIVGTLVDIGLNSPILDEMPKILKNKDRKKAGRCAPPQGLCLIKVNF
ncbi:tRNA pseudouridine(38-40) synthase TruA [Candidatus Saganbacteria bacterium]|nr:tRNA pseudouridine(38-40) synthase TruA [Candidatus Saganbacteria bacterium]